METDIPPACRPGSARFRGCCEVSCPLFARLGKRGQKALGVGMLGFTKNMVGLPLLRDDPGIHHVNTIGNRRDHSEIVGNIEERHVPFFLQFSKQAEDLGLDRHVQSRRRLIGNHEVGIACEGHGNHHALSLTAAELMGVILQALFRRRDAHIPQELDASVSKFLLINVFMNHNGLSNLIPDR